ncbi:MAG: PEP-CTERM sorting domain-containing protein [Acetobacteraceae bacterium]|nr:PEP-CTERM sorting domain-containing protein [Acetobacteraceae bacterium]
MGGNLRIKVMGWAIAIGAGMIGSAHALPFNDLFVFGDSYSDTGAFFPLTNGSTAVGYLAQDLGITLTTSKNPSPGTEGVNFAESGARVANGPTPPATQPRSLTQQVAEFQNYVTTGNLTFNPSTSLFMLLGGLNDHTTPQSVISAATASQVATLYSLGARYFEIGIIPSLVPAFADSAANVNPVYLTLVPQLQAEYPDAHIQLSQWGPFYDDILRNPSAYGITNTTDPCFDFTTNQQTCSTPQTYFYYYIVHPSDAAHHIVGNELYQEALAFGVPEPMSLALIGTGLLALTLTRRSNRE